MLKSHRHVLTTECAWRFCLTVGRRNTLLCHMVWRWHQHVGVASLPAKSRMFQQGVAWLSQMTVGYCFYTTLPLWVLCICCWRKVFYMQVSESHWDILLESLFAPKSRKSISPEPQAMCEHLLETIPVCSSVPKKSPWWRLGFFHHFLPGRQFCVSHWNSKDSPAPWKALYGYVPRLCDTGVWVPAFLSVDENR